MLCEEKKNGSEFLKAKCPLLKKVTGPNVRFRKKGSKTLIRIKTCFVAIKTFTIKKKEKFFPKIFK